VSVEVNPQTVSLDSSPELPTQSAGTSLGRYVVLGELGRGGMGVVLRAYDPKLQREVALKCLKPGVLSSDQGERLIREAQAMAKLSHPNVVAIYDVELESERVTLTMEYVEGQTLRKWLADHARSPTEILTCFIEAGRGLTAAHEAGLLHRDFKPANVLVSRSGTVKVTDFGLARLDEAHQNISADPEAVAGSLEDAIGPSRDSGSSRVLTQAGDVMGTPAYMAPEQHVGGSMTPAVDQYAFCVSLWQALRTRAGIVDPVFRGSRRMSRYSQGSMA
jgi:serine/threonine protein kinase